jgi:hypothetical protein
MNIGNSFKKTVELYSKKTNFFNTKLLFSLDRQKTGFRKIIYNHRLLVSSQAG